MTDDETPRRPIVDISAKQRREANRNQAPSTGSAPVPSDDPDTTEDDHDDDAADHTADRTTGRGHRVRTIVAILALVITAALVLRIAQGPDETPVALLPTPTPQPVLDDDARFLQAIIADDVEIVSSEVVGIDVPTRLHLFYGGDEPITWLDLATGDVDTSGIRVEPLVQSGDHLVLASADHRLVGWLPLTALGEMPQGWTASRIAPTAQADHSWFFHLDTNEWVNMNLGTGRIVERRVAQGQTTSAVQPWHDLSLISGPDLISTADGVYAWTIEGYLRVNSGRVLASTDTHVLLERCDPPDAPCTMAWFDRSTWDQVEWPTPSEPVRSIEVAGGGRWLQATDRDNTGIELIELATSRRLRFDPKVTTVTVSDDGRLVAFVRRGAVHLADLDRLETLQVLGAFGEVSEGRLRFVVMPDGT